MKRQKNIRKKAIPLWWVVCMSLFSAGIVSCVSTDPSVNYGIRRGFEAYIPARIAVLSCRVMPPGLRYSGQFPFNVADEDLKGLCHDLDRRVIEGFSNQPYMKGFTPALVAAFLSKAGAEDMTEEISALWQSGVERCHSCENGPQAYQVVLENSVGWHDWLNRFSRHTDYADAILMPMISEAVERVSDDRGAWIAERYARIELFLIDTNNGKLLWAGGRSASISSQSLRKTSQTPPPPYPHWDRLKERLFTETIWQGFPGRQLK
ncbi:MAG: hypothetical protein H6618_03575 [Deltaproteobacteria bacterium]|nr:hypothetical protein [Deltaproteobacteria bacterium]